ncbi:ABC transporter substrate-binding protein [Scytonema sp. NUACC26]|uniref:ABC transporter substrate-binding protein n=1 Tax=Scytonema sp. NUACC26 TaxID=3140176 RepID=UPI0034DBE022
MRLYSIFTAVYRRWLAILLALTTAIALISCNLVSLKTAPASVSQLVFSSPIFPKTFNPALAQAEADTLNFTSEGLVGENSQGGVEPYLAEAWEISENSQRIIFTLRKGLRWSDGVALTADDVLFTYNDVYLNEAIPTDARDLLKIGKNQALPTIRKLDELRVEFSLPEPFTPFLRTTRLPILPEHALKESVNTKDAEGKPKFLSTWGIDTPPEKIIVNGPYKIEAFTASERIIFRKNPYYWRKDAQGNSQPYIKRVIRQIVDNTGTSLIQFRSGGLHYIDVPSEYFSLLKREEKRGKFTIYNGGSSGFMTFVSFNLNKGIRNGKPIVDPIKSRWFNTLEFRQAIAYAIDRQQMLNNIFRGLGNLQNSSFPVQSPEYLSPKEGLKVYDYNPQKAKELLVKAGFKYTSTGQLLDSEGNLVRFTLMTNAGNKIREPMAAQIKRNLSQIGIQVDLNPLANSLFLDKIFNSWDWEFLLFGNSATMEPNDLANVWLPESSWHYFNRKPSKGQPLIVGHEVAEWEQKIGDLYIQGARELDAVKRKAIYAETQRIAQEYLPFIYIVNPFAMAAVRNHIHNIKFSAVAGAFWNVYELKLK